MAVVLHLRALHSRDRRKVSKLSWAQMTLPNTLIPGQYTVYYQHYGGDIRYVQLTIDGTFVGGSPSEVVASDAKNSTPISVVQYVVDANLPSATSIWHLFYINLDGYIKQRTYTNATSTGGVW